MFRISKVTDWAAYHFSVKRGVILQAGDCVTAAGGLIGGPIMFKVFVIAVSKIRCFMHYPTDCCLLLLQSTSDAHSCLANKVNTLS